MNNSAKLVAPYREHRFRTPTPLEMATGIWVDRLGRGGGIGGIDGRQRILGQYAVVAIEAGRGIFRHGDAAPVEVGSGDVLVLLPEQPTWYGPVGGPWRIKWLVWNHGAALHDLAAALPAPPERPYFRALGPAVDRAYAAVAPLMEREDRCGAWRRAAAVLEMLADLADADPRFGQQGENGRELTRIVDFMARHFADNLRIDDLAARAKMSQTSFRRLFQAHIGRSPKEHLTAIRIARAREMLADGQPVKTVAFACGYPDPAHFMRTFRRLVGLPPGTFARNCHADRLPAAPSPATGSR